MKPEHKSISFSVTPELGKALEDVKKLHYDSSSQNAMLQDLIARGLAALKQENPIKGEIQ